jgi:hypothetical protein
VEAPAAPFHLPASAAVKGARAESEWKLMEFGGQIVKGGDTSKIEQISNAGAAAIFTEN